jgi:hypothetical protein
MYALIIPRSVSVFSSAGDPCGGDHRLLICHFRCAPLAAKFTTHFTIEFTAQFTVEVTPQLTIKFTDQFTIKFLQNYVYLV